ncbi:MAG: endopeptidase La [Desulfobaccales bacterium]
MAFFRKSEEPAPQVSAELKDLRAAVAQTRLPEHVAPVVIKELERLEKTDPSVPEYIIGINYVEYLLGLPWYAATEDNLDLKRAEQILASEHFGLKHVKERILEYLAVRTLCLVRPFQVLVVDDEEIARANLEHILKKEGYQVRTAANGMEALERLQEQEVDLILTDLKMEKMDGLQLLEAAKEIAPQVAIMMVTGYATVDSAVEALQKGAVHYLSKPIKIEEMRAAVRRLSEKKRLLQNTRGPVLCFSGPPGTGKTSIGRSIAHALERKFVRLSLAGLRDEAELRGHRRTYVGAMPGRIINEIKRLGVKNPVFMLDEIDKVGQGFKGDPASVLLEILDPEQNSAFFDHYLDVPFDLSGVMFIATANVVENLPRPLLDRLEVIEFPGYSEQEKRHIAQDYLIPRQLHYHGLSHLPIKMTDEAVLAVIRGYTREAGLRNLEREIATICRKLARRCLKGEDGGCPLTIDATLVEQLLGPRRFIHEATQAQNRIGVTTGLVWTEFGGEIIFVEAAAMKGNKQLILTGSLGNVLQESAQTALSYIRSHAAKFHIDPDFFAQRDIHIHLPAGSIPKDGPSAGLTIALALISLLTGRPARREVALSGELTLSGRILPVSGIREKLLAAQRAGVRKVILPQRNAVDLNEIEEELKEGLEVILVNEVDQTLLDAVLLPAAKQPSDIHAEAL